MSLFEYSVIGVNLFCDDKDVREEIIKKSFANMNVYNLVDVESEDVKQSNYELNKSIIINDEGNEESRYYFNEEKMEAILGERFKIELDEWDINHKENICFVASKEEFMILKDFDGYLICLEDAYVSGIRKQQIVVKSREDALDIIYSMYFTFSSYHIFPCDITIPMTDGFNIIVDKILIKEIDNYRVVYWLYRNIGSQIKDSAAFLITDDKDIKSKSGFDIYESLNELLSFDAVKFYLSDKNKDYSVVSLYTLELGKIK